MSESVIQPQRQIDEEMLLSELDKPPIRPKSRGSAHRPLEPRLSEIRIYPSRASVSHITGDQLPDGAQNHQHAATMPPQALTIHEAIDDDNRIHVDLDLYAAAGRSIDLGFDSSNV